MIARSERFWWSVSVKENGLSAVSNNPSSPRKRRLPFGDQESVGGAAQRGVMVEAAAAAAFVAAEADLL